jgi:hypothetical protein
MSEKERERERERERGAHARARTHTHTACEWDVRSRWVAQAKRIPDGPRWVRQATPTTQAQRHEVNPDPILGTHTHIDTSAELP